MTDTDNVRPFADFLREQNRGKTHSELGEGLRDLVARVEDTGKKGSITLTITVEPLKGNEEALMVSDEIKLKLPEHDRGASVFFRGRDGNLQRDDPNQPTLNFDDLRVAASHDDVPRGVDPITGEVRDLDDSTPTRKD